MAAVEHIASRLVKYVARYASGLEIDESDLRRITGSTMYPVIREAIYVVAKNIVTERNGLPRCNICGRGPYTRRGLYLHLVRVHRYDIERMIIEEYKRIERIIEESLSAENGR